MPGGWSCCANFLLVSGVCDQNSDSAPRIGPAICRSVGRCLRGRERSTLLCMVEEDMLYGAGGVLTVAVRWRSDESLHCRGEEPGSITETLIQVQTPPYVRRHIRTREAISGVKWHDLWITIQLTISDQGALPYLQNIFVLFSQLVVSIGRIGGRTFPVTPAAPPKPHHPPPPCRRRHRIPVQRSPKSVATPAEGAFEALGEMPETRRTITTAERSAGCEGCRLHTAIFSVSGVWHESRQRLVAAWSSPSPRATAMDFSQNPDPL